MLARVMVFVAVAFLATSCSSTRNPSGVYRCLSSTWFFGPNKTVSYNSFWVLGYNAAYMENILGEGRWKRDGEDIVVSAKFIRLPSLRLDPLWDPQKYEKRTLRFTMTENGELIGPGRGNLDKTGTFARDPRLRQLRRKDLWTKPEFPKADDRFIGTERALGQSNRGPKSKS